LSGDYRQIKNYEKEIIELREQGLTQREIGERFGFKKEQVKGFFKRERRNQEKLEAGIALKKRGRPAKDCVATEKATEKSDTRMSGKNKANVRISEGIYMA